MNGIIRIFVAKYKTFIDDMEPLKHECGVAMIRLLKPLEYYQEKYGTWMYGLNKLYLLMEKQHNRGQEAAGLACVKLQADPGEEYMFRERALGAGAITEIFSNVHQNFRDLTPPPVRAASLMCIRFCAGITGGPRIWRSAVTST